MTDVRPLGRGLDHVAVLVGGDVVLRVALEPDPAARAAGVRCEAALLRAVAAVAPVAVPVPTAVAPADGWLAHPLLPGAPLAEAAPETRARWAAATGAALGRLMAAVAALTPTAAADGLAEVDDAPPAEWLAEARRLHPRVAGRVPPAHGPAVAAFLRAAPPPPAAPGELVLCHDDLGIEHVLVDERGAVTGVIDWSDAAVADPAGDLGRILRDLGPAALDAALAAFPSPDREATRTRALFRARCGAVEDMAYGLDADRPAYVARSVTALGWLSG